MKRSAFTLIEVLVSMAVLMVLTLALTRMFISASDITSRGMTSIARNSVGETAMESILSDLDCMVANERIACYKFADDVERDYFGFDTIYFIGTNGDNDDEMPYEYFKYFVKPVIATNSLGAVYKRFDLVKSRVVMAVGATNKFYALRSQPEHQEWWDAFDEIPLSQQDHEVLAENVVSFDVYCQSWDKGQPADNDNNKTAFNSTKPMNGMGVANLPPVSFDVHLKITSPEAAIEGGMLLVANGKENQDRGRELLNREATSLFGRAMPMMGTTQYRLQRRSSYNPVSHYYSED